MLLVRAAVVSRRGHDHPGAEAVAVGRTAAQPQDEPVVVARRGVAQQLRSGVDIAHDQVGPAVAFDVSRRHSARDALRQEGCAGFAGDFAQQRRGPAIVLSPALVPLVEKHLVRLGVPLRRIQRMAVGNEQVGVSIAVSVDEDNPEAERHCRGAAHADRKRVFREQPRRQRTIYVHRLLFVVGHTDLGKAVAVEIAHVDPHPGLGQALDTQAGSRHQSDIFEAQPATVHVHEVAGCIVGYIQVG